MVWWTSSNLTDFHQESTIDLPDKSQMAHCTVSWVPYNNTNNHPIGTRQYLLHWRDPGKYKIDWSLWVLIRTMAIGSMSCHNPNRFHLNNRNLDVISK